MLIYFFRKTNKEEFEMETPSSINIEETQKQNSSAEKIQMKYLSVHGKRISKVILISKTKSIFSHIKLVLSCMKKISITQRLQLKKRKKLAKKLTR
jgi:hypothetical protein